MAASMISIRRDKKSGVEKRRQQGFSLLEVVISMAILTVGLVSLLGVFGLAMASTLTSQEDMIAKQLANEALESVITARNTSQLTWDDIQNTGSVDCTGAVNPCGKFVTGSQPINNAGADGIYGTSDDSTAGLATLTAPGPDGIYGTADDVQMPLSNYQRTIAISQVSDANGNVIESLRGVNITVQYSTTQTRQAKTYVLSSFISKYQ